MQDKMTAAYVRLEGAVGGRTFLLLFTVVLLPLTWRLMGMVRQYYRLRHIPGPRIAGFTKWWYARAILGGRQHLDIYEATLKYGIYPLIDLNKLGDRKVRCI
jgi:hypothetical protein